MSQCGESSAGGRSRSRLQVSRSSRPLYDPIGELSGFPLIICPDCGVSRVVEGRTKKDSENHGRLYFKCGRNGYPQKLCGYYRFERQYFQKLVDDGVVVIRPANWAELVEDEVDSVECQHGHGDKHKSTALEEKMALMWKIIFFLWGVLCVVLGSGLMYAAMK